MINKIKQFFKQKPTSINWQKLITQDRRNFLLVFGLFIIITAAFFAVYKINKQAQAGWWNDTWQYRKSITVGSGSSAASNYQVLINNYDTATDITAGKMQSDCSDLRFTSLEGVELPYWIESGCNSSTTDIWVKVDEIPASGGTSIYMYYGNPTAGSASNEDNTFIFADDFEQNDISKWNNSVSNATNSVQQRTTTQKKSGSYGVESYQTGTDDGDTMLKHAFSARPVIMEAEFYDTATLTSGETIIFGSLGFYAGVATGTSTTNYSYRCGASWAATTLARSTGWHRIKAVYTGATAEIYIDGTSYATCSSLPTANTMQYGSAWLVTSAGFYADNLIMREYLATEPTTSVGSEEQGTSPIAYYSFDEGYGTTVHNQMEKNGEHGLIGWWKFDDASSSTSPAPQDSMGINDGTWAGNASYTGTSKIGNAATFDGTGDYVTIADSDSLDINGSVSVSAWINLATVASATYTVLGKRDISTNNINYLLVIDGDGSNGAIRFGFYDGTTVHGYRSNYVLSASTWHHVVATYNGNGTVTTYVDGIPIPGSCTTGTCTGAATANSDGLAIGTPGDWLGNYFNGQIDEVKIYNRELTSKEVTAQYNSVHGHMIYMEEATDWVEGAKQNPQQRALGKALEFDGDNERVETSIDAQNTVITAAAWFKADETSTSQMIVSQGRDYYGSGWNVNIYSNQIRALFNLDSADDDNEIVLSSAFTDTNNWHHVVATYDGSTAKLYLDSVLIDSESQSGSITYKYSETVTIGELAYSSNWSNFNGRIDEVKIYAKALTADQIKKEYNRGAGTVMGAGTHAGTGAAPKGFWKLDEGSGYSAFDSSGNNNTGILTNMDAESDWVAGKVGKGLDFDSSDDYITVADPGTSTLDITGALTASAWVKWDTLKDYGVILNKGTGGTAANFNYAIWSYASGKVSGYIGNGSTGNTVQSTTTFITDTWYHITFIADGSNLKLYVNGSLDNTASQTITPAANNDSFTISQSLYVLDGQIDHVKVYNYARTPEQIHYDMATGSPVAYYSFNEGAGTTVHNSQEKNGENGLVSWWKFDTASSGTITTAYDEKGVNNGTGYNATYSSTAKIGNSGYFYTGDATNDYVTVADNDSLDLTAVTISAWVRPTDVSGYGTILGKRDSASATTAYAFRSNNTQLDFYWKNSGSWQVYTTSDANLAINTWYYLTATYDGTSVKVYKNGVLLTGSCTSGTCNNALEITDDNLGIGWSGEMGSEFWDGYLDSVKLYNRALSAAEITADYNSIHGHMINMAPASDWVEGAKQNPQQRPLGKALDFDGSNDRVHVPYNSKLNFSGRAAFSVSAWINPKVNNAYGSIATQSDGSTNTFVMAMNSSGQIEAGRIIAATGSTVIPTNKWTHVVFTYDGTYINVYVNAKVDATPTGDINNAGSSDDLLIGAYNYTSPSVFFNGSIDEVKIYNYSLTANEVKTEYNRGAAMVLGAGKSDSDTAQNSLVGWWKLDEGSAYSAFDSSGQNNNGALVGFDPSTDWVSGYVGKALEFNHSQYVSVPDSPSLSVSSGLSIGAWVYADEYASAYDMIVNKEYSYEIALDTSTNQVWYALDGPSDGSGSMWRLIQTGYYLPPRVWTYLLLSFDGSTVNFYVNGILVYTNTGITGSIGDDSSTLRIGGREYNADDDWDGKIDQVKVWNSGLSATEVAWEYNQGSPIYHWDFNEGQGVIAKNAQTKSVSTDGLVGFWTMDSTTINDMSGNGNNLTNSGSPTSVTGIKGNAVDYASASSQYSYCTDANCGADLDYQGNGLTVSVWVMADSAASGYRFFADKGYYTSSTVNGGYLLFESDTYGIGFCLRNSSGTATEGCAYQSGASISTTRFQHVVGVYDNSAVKIYVDGVLRNTTSYSSGIQNVSNYFTIGAGYSGINHYWDGKIDHVKVWQRALSAAEVAIEYGYDEKYGYLTNMDASSDWVNGALQATNRPMLGKALDFDGSNDYLMIPNASGLQIDEKIYSFSFWIKPTYNAAQQIVMTKRGTTSTKEYHILIGPNGYISFDRYLPSGGGANSSDGAITYGQWNHVVVVFNDPANTVSFYVNGKFDVTSSYTEEYTGTQTGHLYIGRDPITDNLPVSGQIDEIKIYNYGLTANQVKLDYNNSAAVRY